MHTDVTASAPSSHAVDLPFRGPFRRGSGSLVRHSPGSVLTLGSRVFPTTAPLRLNMGVLAEHPLVSFGPASEFDPDSTSTSTIPRSTNTPSRCQHGHRTDDPVTRGIEAPHHLDDSPRPMETGDPQRLLRASEVERDRSNTQPSVLRPAAPRPESPKSAHRGARGHRRVDPVSQRRDRSAPKRRVVKAPKHPRTHEQCS